MGFFRRGNRRVAERRRKVNRLKSCLSSTCCAVISLLPWIAVGGVAVFAGYQAKKFVDHSAYFSIRHVEILGRDHLDESAVLLAAGLALGDHALHIDAKQAREQLVKHPWIVDAYVEVQIPDRLYIRVRERQPEALLLVGDLYFVDQTGNVFGLAQDDLSKWDLPVITGFDREEFLRGRQEGEEQIQLALSLVRLMRRTSLYESPGLSEVHLDPVMGFQLVTLEGGAIIRLGNDDFKGKLARCERVWADLVQRGERASIIMLDSDREPERVVVRLLSEVLDGDVKGAIASRQTHSTTAQGGRVERGNPRFF